METHKAAPTWLLIFEFGIAAMTMAFLLAGPRGVDALAGLVRQYLHLPRQPAPVSSVLVSAQSAASPVAPTPNMRPAPPTVAPKPAPLKPAPPRAAMTAAPRNAPPTAQKVPARVPAARPLSRRPAPTPVAQATVPLLSPQQYLARLMREGHQLYHAGWYGPATARFKEAARVSPGSPSVHLWYGRSALRMGRTAEARAALERAIALAPSSDAAREARALLERMSGPE